MKRRIGSALKLSDPMEYFETKLKTMNLRELQAYKKRLEENIHQKILTNKPNDQIAPLILYRGILEHEIKTRTNQK
jgi:hypothetical protein